MITWKCSNFEQLSLTELYAIMVLRQEVFVVEQNCPYLDADDRDQVSYHLMGFDEMNHLVAYARLIPKGISYKDAVSIGRVVSSSKIRGQGIGRVLMEQALVQVERVFNTTFVILSAQAYLKKFYESLGFQAIGEGYLEDGIPHIKMKKC